MSSSLPILVPVDDRVDMRAVEFARQLAPAIDADVRVLSVVSDRSVAADREAALGAAVQGYGDPIPEVRVVAHHDVAAAIVDASPSASTICMTTAATLRPHEGHFGSIAEAVVRMLSRPVTLLGPKAQGPFAGVGTRLIVPVDGSVAGEYVIDSAAALAAVLQAELWVVTVLSAREERRAAELAGDDYSAIETGYERTRRPNSRFSTGPILRRRFSILPIPTA